MVLDWTKEIDDTILDYLTDLKPQLEKTDDVIDTKHGQYYVYAHIGYVEDYSWGYKLWSIEKFCADAINQITGETFDDPVAQFFDDDKYANSILNIDDKDYHSFTKIWLFMLKP